MKKLLWYYSVLIMAMMFTACDPEGETVDPVPMITVPNTAPTTAKVGDVITFNVAVVAESNIKSIETRKDNVAINTKTSGFTNSKSDTYAFNYTVQQADAGKSLTFTFVVTDSKSRTANANYTVSVGGTSEFGTTNASVTLLAQTALDPLAGAPGSFYSSSTNTVYNTTDARANAAMVDISYALINNTPSLVSPDARTEATTGGVISNGTITRFTTNLGSGVTYDNATAAQVAAITDFTASTVSLQAGQSIAFRNAAGKKGIIKVNSITNTGRSPHVSLSIKVLK